MPGAYEIAQSWLNTPETDAKLNDFLYNGGRNLSAAERAWCSDFVKASYAKAGIETNATGMARSWLDEGTPVDDPQPGDVAVLSRTNDPSLGHVGFFEGRNPDGTIKLLSGNYGDTVASASYPTSRVLGYRRIGPAQDPRNVAMNGKSAGVDPDGFAGVSGAIHTQTPGDVGTPWSNPPPPPSPPPTPGTQTAGAFEEPTMKSVGKGIAGLAGAFAGGGEDQAAAQLQKQNDQMLSEEERRAQAALDLVRNRKKSTMRPTLGAFS